MALCKLILDFSFYTSYLTCMDKFTAWWVASSPKQKQALADKMETSIPYLSQLAHGHRKGSRHFVRLLEIETGFKLKERRNYAA